MYSASFSTTHPRAIPDRPETPTGFTVCGRLFPGLVAAFFVLMLAGCETLQYYPHVIGGHLELIAGHESIETLLEDPETDTVLRKQLQTVMEIRRFAADKLLLPVNGQYRSYVKLDRPYVTWNVYATPEFSLAPKTWRYPIVGRAGYRGYFTPERAADCAATLQDSGLDVYIVGASAYSTLGWFADPLPSTVVARDETALANLIFHELAHQLLYVSGDTTFNESFASAVAEEGTRRYLASPEKLRQQREYRQRRLRHKQFTQLVAEYRRRLENLYGRQLETAVMRRRKQAVFTEMLAAYRRLRDDWQGYGGYDAWFEPPLNNAKIASLSTYNELVEPILALLEEKNGNLRAFYSACRDLAQMTFAERRQRLQQTAPAFSNRRTAAVHSQSVCFLPGKKPLAVTSGGLRKAFSDCAFPLAGRRIPADSRIPAAGVEAHRHPRW